MHRTRPRPCTSQDHLDGKPGKKTKMVKKMVKKTVKEKKMVKRKDLPKKDEKVIKYLHN